MWLELKKSLNVEDFLSEQFGEDIVKFATDASLHSLDIHLLKGPQVMITKNNTINTTENSILDEPVFNELSANN